MALDPDVFADLAESFLQEEMEAAFPNMIRKRTVVSEVREDGSTSYSFQDELGPPEVDREKIRPMFRAVGRAIVELLKGSAEVDDQGTPVTPAGKWRIQ
jgi:hypothetical protein